MRYLTQILIAGTMVLSTAPAQADLGDQLAKLLPDDGAAGDRFGHSVAISGAVAIVGAVLEDENGDGSGSAYLFDISDRNNPVQTAKLLPDDGAAEDNFGVSVAISSTTAIVGAHRKDDNGSDSGSAYLFDTATGRQLFKLLPNDGAVRDWFGWSVAITGAPGKEIAIVGAPKVGDDSGSVYLFDTTTGQQIFKLIPNDVAMNDLFGVSVATSGTTAIIGASQDNGNASISGSAYIFDLSDPANPKQVAKLLADDGATFDSFGFSVAISGTTAIVGANEDNDNGSNSGSAYIFDTIKGRQLFKLLPDDGAAHDRFGWSVSISGTTAIVGANWNDDNGSSSGSAYLFNTVTGEQIVKLVPKDNAAGDRFGVSVVISGATAMEVAFIGAELDDDNRNSSGSAYLFDAAAPGTCPWDIDDNGVVGASDLLLLLASWGPCKGCPADFDGNGTVGASDLLALLANWGPCP